MCKLKSSLVNDFCVLYAQHCLQKIEKTRLMLEWLTPDYYDDEKQTSDKLISELVMADFKTVIEI